tara:strand:+ start:1934 stop:2971 length:1038 start_codon:yes stop_codon:yes gene_type:complete
VKTFLKNFWGTILICILFAIIAGLWGWETDKKSGLIHMLWIFVILLILEISLSFDNAVVNASILKNWNAFWQTLFLTIGVLIAVFGMRLVFPLLVVSVTTEMTLIETWFVAINEPENYSNILLRHHGEISAFGGIFLLLIFLNYFFDSKKCIFWIPNLEKRFSKLGNIKGITIFLSLSILLFVAGNLPDEEKFKIVMFGLWGLIIYLGIDVLSQAITPNNSTEIEAIKRGSLGGFIYIEVLDASFSIDAVVGAFAITKDIIIIMLGLGAGAMAVRSITIYLIKQGTLNELIYLEHGAHYAIGALALIMITSVHFHVPEIITGTVGLLLVVASAIHSMKIRKNNVP